MAKPKYVLIPNEYDDEDANRNVYLYEKYLQPRHFVIVCLLTLSLYLIYIQSSLDFANVSIYKVDNTTEVNEIMNETTQYLSTSHLKISHSTRTPSVKPTIYYTTSTVTQYLSTRTPPPKPTVVQTSEKYFIYTSQCRVPFVDPFGDGIKRYFNRKDFKYSNCTNDEALITSNYQLNTTQYILHMNIPAIERAVKSVKANVTDVRCCYRQIVRSGSNKWISADDKYTVLPCSIFNQDFKVPQDIDYIITECYINNKKRKVIQKDAFSFIQQQNVTMTNFSTTPAIPLNLTKAKKPSVLLLGIDSLSRINLRRTMPETLKFLQNNHWFELQGYNKVGDNTFPNLMPLLTSYNITTAFDKCKPTTRGGLNKPICNLIWNNFKQYGYKTAYAEDAYSLSTFNYLKKGFLKPPTDYYLRPMMMAISNNLKVKTEAGLSFCIGRKHSADYIYDYALQFANAFPKDPLFGLFWTNSFSHNWFALPARMDVKILEYLQKMKSDDILERTIVILFADHGMRWGQLLHLKSAFLEERLPTMFISLPTWYRNENPDFVKALGINQKRLTSPYDIYATFKHILEVSEPEKRFPYVNDTIEGLSIFREIPENRTCAEAGIPEHWCTCTPYENLPATDVTAKNVTILVINEINHYLAVKNITHKCCSLTLKSIKKVEKKMYDKPNQSTYRITFIANPKEPNFQATVVYDKIARKITANEEEISRLNSYAKTADCIDLKEAKKFCICKKKVP